MARRSHPGALWLGAYAALLALLPAAALAEVAPLERVEVLAGGATAGDEGLPVVVAIHGLGDRPEAFADLFDGLALRARVVLPRAPRPWGPGFAWMPGRTHPGRAAAERRSADRVAALLRSLRGKPSGSGPRPIVTGFSQGGILSFLVAVRHPDLVGAAVPLSGYLPESARPPRRRDGVRLPLVRALHGTDDRVLGIRGARRSVERLRRRGWDAELREHEGVGHTVTGAMRDELHALLAALVGEGSPPP